MNDALEWLIRKGGYFYRPNMSGYTTAKHEAGRYTKEDAEREARIEPWHMKAIHENEWPDDKISAKLSTLAAENERLKAMVAEMEGAISEYYRYHTGGETRGSYDGKPERNRLWRAMYAARALIARAKGAAAS